MPLDFLQAYLLTVLLETIALFVLLRKGYAKSLLIRNSVIASTLTLPFVWFLFPYLGFSYLYQILLSEEFAVIIEAIIYAKLFRGMSLRDAFLLSFACNMFSFSFGVFLNDFITMGTFPWL
jgi:hypothetical protein